MHYGKVLRVQAVWEMVSYVSGFSGVRLCRFPSRNWVGNYTFTTNQPCSWLCVCGANEKEFLVSRLKSPTRATRQQCMQNPLQTGLGHPFGDRSSCSPHLVRFGILLNFLKQPYCGPLFNWAYSSFCRTCCHLENTLSIYKEEATCE